MRKNGLNIKSLISTHNRLIWIEKSLILYIKTWETSLKSFNTAQSEIRHNFVKTFICKIPL